MKEANLKLSMDEVNIIVGALGKLPYEKSFMLINNMHAQLKEQSQEEQNKESEKNTRIESKKA